MNVLERFSLAGKTAVVTGGTGQLGWALCRAFLEAGARVALTDKAPFSSERIKALVGQYSERLFLSPLDVTQKNSIKSAIAHVSRKWGSIDIWVNNAGVGIFTPYTKRTAKEWDWVVNVNLKGTFLCTQAVLKHMTARRQGNIINIGSIYGVVAPDPRIYGKSKRNSSEVYGATKAAIVQMTRYFAVHSAPHGIRINCVSPGGLFNHQDPSFVQQYCHRTPLERMAEAEDIIGAVIFLASDNARYITGQNLLVDGGWTLW